MFPVPFLRRRRPGAPATGAPTRRTAVGGDDAPSPTAVRVTLLGDLARLGPGLELGSRGRLACTPDPADATILMTPPCGRATLHQLLESLPPGSHLVVVDPHRTCTPLQIAGFLDDGAATVVLGTSIRILTAHAEALIRRHPTGSAREGPGAPGIEGVP